MPGSLINSSGFKEALNDTEIVILDMDGTLYELDGDNKSFSNSSLENAIHENAIRLISNHEQFSREDSEKIIEFANSQNLYLSIYLGEKYGLSRSEYFNIVWNIDPNGKIINFEGIAETIKKLRERGKYLILLTSAPRVWEEKVLAFLGISKYFSEINSGEEFMLKNEVFAKIRSSYPNQKIISIGDQENTDILPALTYDINGYLVKGPKYLIQSIDK